MAEGVNTIFGMMGDGNMYWMDALDKLGMKMLEVRHEGVGCGMADGWARVTRTPGVCTATCGPGTSQLATALLTAARADSPMVAFVGEYPTVDEEYIQRLDQARFAAACETGFVRVVSPGTADEAVRKAFYLARLESRPIMLSAPMDIQQMTFDDDEPYVPSTTLLASRVISPDASGVRQAADIVAASKKPVILVGRGAVWSGAGEAVIKLADRIGAVIATSLRAKGWLNHHEYHVGISGHYSTKTAMKLFEQADCVIAVGASLNRFTVMGNLLYPDAKFIHIDPKAHVLMGGGRAADCYLQADGRVGVEALDAELAKRSVKGTGYRTPDVKKSLTRHFEDPVEFLVEPGSIDPREICLALDQIVPTSVPLASGSGASNGFTNMLCNRPRPFVMGAQFYGCIGQMLPACMGAIAATGNKPMLLIDGDASTMMHLADFDTAVRYNLPLLVVVLNDQALGSEYHKMLAHNMKAELSTIPTPDIGAVAKALGGKGCLATTIEQVRAAATEWVANPCPTIIDARISRNVQTLATRRIIFAKDE
jgi:acetolactate synthase I/II/III large subunit